MPEALDQPRFRELMDSYNGYAKEMLNKFSIAKKLAHATILGAQKQQRQSYNTSRISEKNIAVGDRVWYDLYKLEEGTTSKLALRILLRTKSRKYRD